MDPITAIANGLGSIFNSLGTVGIGTKSRQKEIAAIGEVQAEAAAERSKTTTKILVVSGILIFVIVIIVLTLRKK